MGLKRPQPDSIGPASSPAGYFMQKKIRRGKGGARLPADNHSGQRSIGGPSYKLFRYRALEDLNDLSFQAYGLLGSAGVMTVGDGIAHQLYDSMRLGHVKVIGAPPLQGTTSTVKLEFFGGANAGAGERFINVTNGIYTSPNVHGKPSNKSSASKWFQSPKIYGTDPNPTLFQLTCPEGSVIELGCWVTQYDDLAVGHAHIVPMSAPPGQTRYVPPAANVDTIK